MGRCLGRLVRGRWLGRRWRWLRRRRAQRRWRQLRRRGRKRQLVKSDETQRIPQSTGQSKDRPGDGEAERRSSGEIRVLVSRRKVEDALATAQREFLRLGMAKTRQRNGVLLYFAPLSQRFAIVGDTGVHGDTRRCFLAGNHRQYRGLLERENSPEPSCWPSKKSVTFSPGISPTSLTTTTSCLTRLCAIRRLISAHAPGAPASSSSKTGRGRTTCAPSEAPTVSPPSPRTSRWYQKARYRPPETFLSTTLAFVNGSTVA